MQPTSEHHQLAKAIHDHVTHVVATGGGDEQLLVSMADHMSTFKRLLDTCSTAQMDALCDRYSGFFRFAKLLENLAQGIADGTIPVPPET